MAARPCFLLLCLAIAAAGGVHQARAQVDSNGFINIDCGLPGPASTMDENTKLSYSPDTGFIDAGSNHDISVEYIYSKLINLYHNVRSFPNGERNCYTLRSLVPGIKYLIRAYFLYGNYDGLNTLPIFDLYIGANFWVTVNISTSDRSKVPEAIVLVPGDSLSVCLVNTGGGTPFISGLDLRPLKSELYPQVTATQGLLLAGRTNFGPTNAARYIRYPDDSRDRVWFPLVDRTEFDEEETFKKVQSLSDDLFEVPTAVMQTAITPRKFSKNTGPLLSDPLPGCLVVLHIAELRLLRSKDSRQFYIRFNDELLYPEAYTPGYLVNGAVYNTVPVRSSHYTISMEATSTSTLPPILNAMEIFIVMSTTKAYIQDGAGTPGGSDTPGGAGIPAPGKPLRSGAISTAHLLIGMSAVSFIAHLAVL